MKNLVFFHENLLNLVYKGVEGKKKIIRIMEHFRSLESPELFGMKILAIEDYLSGKKINLASGKSELLDTPKSNVLGYHFEDNIKIYLRPSGTEPKIKFYTMIQKKAGPLIERKKSAKILTSEILDSISRIAESC